MAVASLVPPVRLQGEAELARASAARAAAEAGHLAEGALHRTLAALLTPAGRAGLPRDGRPIPLTLEGRALVLSVGEEAGRLDLNAAEGAALARLWPGPRDMAAGAARFVLAGRPWPSVGALVAAEPGWMSVAPLLTVATGTPLVDPWLADPRTLAAVTDVPQAALDPFLADRALRGDAADPAPLAGAPVARGDGRVWRLEAALDRGDGAGPIVRRLVVRLTGQPSHPYRVLGFE